jgi:hypothetical protein
VQLAELQLEETTGMRHSSSAFGAAYGATAVHD